MIEPIIIGRQKVYMVDQGSDGWWEVKRGIPSASDFDRILTAGGKVSAQADDYINELVADTLCQLPNYFTEKGIPINHAIANGLEMEPKARRWYEFHFGYQTERVGFITPLHGLWGCSPDGIVGLGTENMHGIEIKCPRLKTHIGYLRAGELPKEYRHQVHGSLNSCPDAKFWDFVSYHDSAGVPGFHVRVFRDGYTEAQEIELTKFAANYRQVLEQMRGTQ